jgi:hypothetical protein
MLAVPGILTALFPDSNAYAEKIVYFGISVISAAVFFFAVLKIWDCLSEDNSNKLITVKLQRTFSWRLTSEIISSLPVRVSEIVHSCDKIDRATDKFIDRYNKLNSDSERAELLEIYFLELCNYLGLIFDHSSRVHIRILRNNQYEKFIASFDGQKETDPLAHMNLNNKMINTSFKHNCSLVKTCNPRLHQTAAHDDIWQDYITFAITRIAHRIGRKDKPVFTFGVSSRTPNDPILKILNFLKIEGVIGDYFKRICAETDFRDFIARYYK